MPISTGAYIRSRTRLPAWASSRVTAWAHSVGTAFAIPCYGAVMHTLNLRLPCDQLAYIINHAEDQVIFVDASLFNLLEPIRHQIPTVKHFVILPDQGTPAGDYERLLQ